jgi:AcrR family transcriptional regulator
MPDDGKVTGRAPLPRRSSLRDRKREVVRREIAHAAWRLFDVSGYEATTVEDIAREAGVSRRSFFRYFSSKEDVAVGTSDAFAEDFLAAFSGRPVSEAPLESIRRALHQVAAERLADPEEMRAIIRLLRESPTLRRAMLARNARMEERLAELVARRTRANLRRDPTPALLAFLARALMDTAFNVWFDHGPRDVGRMIDDLFLGLRRVVAAGVPAAGRSAQVRAAAHEKKPQLGSKNRQPMRRSRTSTTPDGARRRVIASR